MDKFLEWHDGIATAQIDGHTLTVQSTVPAGLYLTETGPRWYVTEGPRLVCILQRYPNEGDASIWGRIADECPWFGKRGDPGLSDAKWPRP